MDLPDVDLEGVAATVLRDMQPHLGRGRVADYIPALASVDPRHFGLAIVACDGQIAAAGDADASFSVQSISKVFTLTMALEKLGSDLWRRVGREPSGSAFNSIVQLEREKGVPRNPLINPGALVVADALLDGGDPAATIAAITAFVRRAADDPGVSIDAEVAASETAVGFRNASLANFLRAEGNLTSPVADVLQVYVNHCALALSCRQLARSALYLASGGVDPLTGAKLTTPMRARRINALMMTSGHYDASGDFAFRVGLPGKSGVGGGILAIAPRRAAIAVWSPGLNPQGSSLVGVLALQRLASLTGWSVF
ncbi:MAG TPA: glutaminase [Caulobacteraceae bacterium]|nr:glutaminase [Caulobacteraceae bacterium]